MKKSKIIPAVLLLVLCLGVLGVGIYAASPINSSIIGEVHVNSANAELDITIYDEEDNVLDSANTRKGAHLEVGELALNAQDATTANDVKPVILRINIKNKSTKHLGAYFYSGEGLDSDNLATESSITTISQIVDNNGTETTADDITIANAYLSSYSYISPTDNADGGYDEIDMYVIVEYAQIFDTIKTGGLNLTLNVEEYSTTITEDDIVAGSSDADSVGSPDISGLVKLPVGIDRVTSYAFIRNSNIKYVVLPSSVQTIYNYPF